MTDFTKLLDRLEPPQDGESPVRHRTGTVNAVNSDGTVDLDLGGVVVDSVSVLEGPLLIVGDEVQVVVWRGDLLVLGRRATRRGHAVRVRGWALTDKTNFAAVNTMEVWDAAQNLGIFPTGRAFWVSAQLAGSIFTASGLDKSGQVRVGISADGGSTWDYGPSVWCSAVSATRRSACGASHGARVVSNGTNDIKVVVEAQISGGATTDMDFITGGLTAQMAPDV